MKNIEVVHTHDTLDILHHAGVINIDLNILSEHYEKPGFLLTPVSMPEIIIEREGQPTALGAGNRHAIFENNYLELPGIVDRQKWKRMPDRNDGHVIINTDYEGGCAVIFKAM